MEGTEAISSIPCLKTSQSSGIRDSKRVLRMSKKSWQQWHGKLDRVRTGRRREVNPSFRNTNIIIFSLVIATTLCLRSSSFYITVPTDLNTTFASLPSTMLGTPIRCALNNIFIVTSIVLIALYSVWYLQSPVMFTVNEKKWLITEIPT